MSFCDIEGSLRKHESWNQLKIHEHIFLGKGYQGSQPKPKASADNLYLYLDYSEYHKNRI